MIYESKLVNSGEKNADCKKLLTFSLLAVYLTGINVFSASIIKGSIIKYFFLTYHCFWRIIFLELEHPRKGSLVFCSFFTFEKKWEWL